MLIALVVMLTTWIIAWLIGKYWLKNCGKFLAAFLAVMFAGVGGFVQVYIAATLNEASNVQVDPMPYISNAFLTFCILIYVVYTSLRVKDNNKENA